MTNQEYLKLRAQMYAEWQAELMRLPYGEQTPERKTINSEYDKRLDELAKSLGLTELPPALG